MNKTLISSVKDAMEAECKGGVWDCKPIIPFIPEAKDESLVGDVFVEVVVRMNPTGAASTANTIKKKVKKHNHGSVEELLRWKRELESVIRTKPVKDPSIKFDMAELLLGEDPLQNFQELRNTICKATPAFGGGGEEGETDFSFKSCINRLLEHYFPQVSKNPSGKQKRYMRQGLRKPRGVRVKQIFMRLTQMNSLFPLFPEPDNNIMSEAELEEVIVSMCPNKWQIDMACMNFDPSEYSLRELQTVLEKLELIEDTESLQISKKTHSVIDLSTRIPNKERAFGKPKSSFSLIKKRATESPCALCVSLDKNGSTHSIENFFMKHKIKGFLSGRHKSNGRYIGGGYQKRGPTSKELNVIIAKSVRKITKRQFKKAGVEYSSDASTRESS